MKKLLLILMLINVFAPEVYARSKKNTESKYNFVYERTWYLSLSEKQQAVYLKTMDKLAYQIATGRQTASLDYQIMNLFMHPAFAAGLPFDNGYYHPGESFDSLLNKIDMGSLEPKCPKGEKPCAVYTGLVRNSSGEYKLACSPRSTPTCVKRGSQDLLKQARIQCKGELCLAIDRLMEVGTKGVQKVCKTRRKQDFCNSAMAALAGEDIPPAPNETSSPSGRDCGSVSNDVVQAHQKAHPRSKKNSGISNNSFWGEVTAFAQKACPNNHKNISNTMKVIGLCNVKNMTPGGAMSVSEVKSYTQSDDAVGFKKCVSNKRNSMLKERDTMIKRVETGAVKTGSGSNEEKQKRIVEIRARYESKLANLDRVYGRSGAECSGVEKRKISDAAGPSEFKELEPLLSKFKKGKSFTKMEENTFRSVLGLSSSQFRQAFCDSYEHKDFKPRLANVLRSPQRVRGDSRVHRAQEQGAEIARLKMNRCAANLKSVKETDCKFYEVTDRNLLRSASPENPILVKSRDTNACSKLVGHEYIQNGTKKNSRGQEVKNYEHKMVFQTPRARREANMSASVLFRNYKVSVYRCKGDDVRRMKYRPADTEGEQDARDYLNETEVEI